MMMQRRSFITLLGGAAAISTSAWPRFARAQQPNRARRIGFLMNGRPNEEIYLSYVNVFTQNLQKLGWRDRDNIQVDLRWGEGDVERMRVYAIELVGLAPDIIIASGTPNLTAVLRATRTIPVIFLQVTDPVTQGFVASLARPGDNITGFAAYEASVGGKWLDLLKKMAPNLARVAVMFNPDTSPQSALFLRAIEAAAPVLGVELITAPVHNSAEIERTIENLSRQPNSGLMTLTEMTPHNPLIVSLVARHGLPAISGSNSYVTDGGLMSYTVDYEPSFRQAAFYVDRFFKGAKLADLPVQLPTRFKLVINMKAAAALGIEVPLPILMSVDEVIE
jgi:putative tryptophan/tyrosine transport system substrate-binding protein